MHISAEKSFPQSTFVRHFKTELFSQKSKEKVPKPYDFGTFPNLIITLLRVRFGGDKRDRTADLLNAMCSIGGQNEYYWIKWSK